jgi:hypothetical protein
MPSSSADAQPLPDAVSSPALPGERHVVEVVGEDLVGAETAPERDFDGREAVDLGPAVVEHADPAGEPREASLERDSAAERVARLG